MNKVVVLILILTITIITFGIAYFVPFFSKKSIRKGKFDIFQFMNLFFAPMLIIPILYFFREIISRNPQQPVIPLPKYLAEIVFLMLLYFMVLGNGIHSVAVVLSKHMKDLRKHRVWQITEYFHHEFSHLLITVSAVCIMFSYVILEVNRPNVFPLTTLEIVILIVCGLVAGVILGLAAVEGSVAVPMFYLLYGLSLLLPIIFVKFDLNYRFFPYSTYMETVFITAVITLSGYKYKRKGFVEIVPQYFFEE